MTVLRLAVRRALRRPWFAVVVVGLLAGAIGMNATVFAVLNTVAFNRLPYPHAERLVDIRLAPRGCEYCARETVPSPVLEEWRRTSRSADLWGSSHSVFTGLVLSDRKRELRGEAVTPSLLHLIGARAQAGRTFNEDDEFRGGPRRVVLSAELWKREYGSDAGIVGQFIRINDNQFEVIGVLDKTFVWPLADDTPDVFVTQGALATDAAMVRVAVIARLAPGATIQRLNGELSLSGRPMVEQLLGRTELRPSAVPLSRIVAFGSALELALLQLLGLVVLGVACANVTGLLIARQQAERHLIGLRAVLGARVRDLVALPLVDVAPLVMAGAGLGLLLATRAAPVAGAYLGASTPSWADAHVDSTVIIATVIVSIIVSAVIALVPAREFFRADLRSWIQTGALATTGSKQARARQQVLVGAQIGISTTLLVVAAILVVNLAKLGGDNARLQRQGMLRAPLTVPPGRDPNRFAEAVIERLRLESGVVGASIAKGTTIAAPGSIAIDGVARASSMRMVGFQVGARFSTVRPDVIVAGRDLTAEEIRDHADHVIVVNEKLAQTVWGTTVPLGRRIRLANDDPWREVVGVRRNSAVATSERVAGNPAGAAPTYWIPGIGSGTKSFSLVVVTPPDADRFVSAVGKAIDDVAPNVVSMLLTDTRLIAVRAEARARTILLAVLASFALIMSIIGIGTLVAFSTGLRSREFGIRTAMGARAGMIASEVVRDAIKMSGRGLLLAAVGTVGAYFLFIPMLYFNAKVFDWRIAAGAVGLMTLLIVAASIMPAIRAARLNPANVLRGD